MWCWYHRSFFPLPSPVHHETSRLCCAVLRDAINIFSVFSLNPKNKRSSCACETAAELKQKFVEWELTLVGNFVQTNKHQQQHDGKKSFNCGCFFSLRRVSFHGPLNISLFIFALKINITFFFFSGFYDSLLGVFLICELPTRKLNAQRQNKCRWHWRRIHHQKARNKGRGLWQISWRVVPVWPFKEAKLKAKCRRKYWREVNGWGARRILYSR